MRTTWIAKIFSLFVGVMSIMILGTPHTAQGENSISQDPNGFAGLEWGTSLGSRKDLVLTEPGDRINAFQFVDSPPRIANIPVESVTLLSIDGQFAKVMIRYQGSQVHDKIMSHLETQYGDIHLMPGAMMRGLNQGYLWRGSNTEINLSYRGLGERGFVTFQSRILAPRFLDSLSDHSH